MDGSTVHAQGTPSYTVYGPEADFFFLFVCHMKFTSPFQFHAPLFFIEYLPTVPYGQVHETTYLLHQIRSWEYGHDLGTYLYLTVGTSLMGQAQVKWGGEIRDTCSWVRCA